MNDEDHIHGFKTPEDYFENFEERLYNRLKADELPQSTGFKVPEGYFDALEDNIIDRSNLNAKSGKVISLFSTRRILYAASVAACLLLLVSIFSSEKDLTSQLSDLDASSIENYINEGNLELNSFDILSLFEEDDIADLSFDNGSITEEILEDYLLENLDDTTLLIE